MQILRSQCAVYAKQYAGRGACFQVQSVLAKLSLCRTRALGGNTLQCDDCGQVTERFHSCGDRHCPQCSGCKRYDFAERAERLILAGVTYYQVVFTLPGVLSELALANRESMADLLFESAAASLRKTIRSEQNFEHASMMVLHTWNQTLGPHWHVHALVPGGGPSLSKDQWKSAQSPPGAVNGADFYLVDAINLREAYRKLAIARLRKLYAKGELKLGGKFAYLQDESAWKDFCDQLTETDWVSFIQPPPAKSCSAEQVVRYLTRYLTGGPISDRRIVAADANHVTFMAREGKRTGGDREQVPIRLTSLEFVRRWCDHIQPEQLTKSRYFGGWCSRKRTVYQTRCRRLLNLGDEHDETAEHELESTAVDGDVGDTVEEDSQVKCPACEQVSLRLFGHTPKPSWSTVLTHLDSRCPAWYAETEHAEFCEYLNREYGIGYEDWCLEMRIESTMRKRTEPPPRQLFLPGLSSERDCYMLEYD
jgi:Putative transposase/Transposase zinc-binding domain